MRAWSVVGVVICCASCGSKTPAVEPTEVTWTEVKLDRAQCEAACAIFRDTAAEAKQEFNFEGCSSTCEQGGTPACDGTSSLQARVVVTRNPNGAEVQSAQVRLRCGETVISDTGTCTPPDSGRLTCEGGKATPPTGLINCQKAEVGRITVEAAACIDP